MREGKFFLGEKCSVLVKPQDFRAENFSKRSFNPFSTCDIDILMGLFC